MLDFFPDVQISIFSRFSHIQTSYKKLCEFRFGAMYSLEVSVYVFGT